MAYVKSSKSLRVATLNGHVFEFAPKVVQYVPDSEVQACVAAGAYRCDEDGRVVFPDEPEEVGGEDALPVLPAESREDPDQRSTAIYAAVKALVKMGNEKDFAKTTGLPKAKAVERLLGFAPSGTELQAAFEKYQEES